VGGAFSEVYCVIKVIYSGAKIRKIKTKNLNTEFKYLLLVRDNEIWLSKQYGRSFDLWYGFIYDILPYRKSGKFVDTKVAAINCRVLTIVQDKKKFC